MSNNMNRKRDERRPAIVRAVPSGDTVTLLDIEQKVVSGPPKEIQLTLLGLKAPLLGKKYMKDGKPVFEKDEPFAWDSREYLRKQLIGKSVVYRVEHEAGQRAYGEIWLDETNIRFTIVEKGWSDIVIRQREGRDPSEEDLALQALREKAQNKKVGIWNPNTRGAIRNMKYRESYRGERTDDLFDFFEKMKNKPLDGIVERVRGGTTLRIYLPKSGDSLLLLLAGLRAPNFSQSNDAYSEPFSREAKFITEHLFLHRNVSVTIEGIDKYFNFFGTVLDEQGRNISINLLRMGLAQVVEWSASPSVKLSDFKEAEKVAQDGKLRIWKDYKAAPASKKGKGAKAANTAENFSAKVVEVVNANTITVRVSKGNSEVDRKISLSSVSVPRLMRRSNDDPEKEEKLSDAEKEKREEARRNSQIAQMGKEFLRKQLIGKTVRCVFDYERPSFTPKNSSEKLPPKPFWSVYLKDKNVAVDLVKNGFATVVPHGTDEPRSADFQSLIISEKQAQKGNKGVHSPKSRIALAHINDLTQQNQAKSAPFLPALQRAGKVNAVVEYVFTGSRVKLFVPSENLMICFVLQGIMTERVNRADLSRDKARNASVEDLYPPTSVGNLALHMTREKLFQRDVQIEVASVDKGGNFLGNLFLSHRAFGTDLVEAGLARLHTRSAERLSHYTALAAAETNAKDNRVGVWKDYDPEEEARKEREAREARDKALSERNEASKIKITVTDIVDGGNFWFQTVGSQTEALEELMGAFQSVDFDSQDAYTPKKGEIVAGKFSIDDNWYRAEVQKITGDDIQLIFVDYGNVETVKASAVRALPEDFSLTILPKQASHGRLALIRVPGLESDYGVDAAAFLKELVWDKELVATVQYKEDNVSYLSVGDPDTKVPINASLVMNGLARVQRSRSRSAFYDLLVEEQEKAKKNRVNMWQYGDIDSE